jgi:hypothetical protein
MNRIAYVAAFVAGYVGMRIALVILRRVDTASWRQAWEQIPLPRRQAIRDTLLAEEGIATDGS